MAKQWLFKGHDSSAIAQLSQRSNIEPVVAQLLLNRGITEKDSVDKFLEARFGDLREPDLLPGMLIASERIYSAIETKTPITVYGDYDADGMTGTSILFGCLRMLQADVQYYVPNRLEDSYGLSCDSKVIAARTQNDHQRRLRYRFDQGSRVVPRARGRTHHYRPPPNGRTTPRRKLDRTSSFTGFWLPLSRTMWRRRCIQIGMGDLPASEPSQKGHRCLP